MAGKMQTASPTSNAASAPAKRPPSAAAKIAYKVGDMVLVLAAKKVRVNLMHVLKPILVVSLRFVFIPAPMLL